MVRSPAASDFLQKLYYIPNLKVVRLVDSSISMVEFIWGGKILEVLYQTGSILLVKKMRCDVALGF